MYLQYCPIAQGEASIRASETRLLALAYQALPAVTFCSWIPVIALARRGRFVDRATRANGAIRAIRSMTPWYPCR